MKGIPENRIIDITDRGLYIRRLSKGDDTSERITTLHKDNYYLLGVLATGTIECRVDFKEVHIAPHTIYIILRPDRCTRSAKPTKQTESA